MVVAAAAAAALPVEEYDAADSSRARAVERVDGSFDAVGTGLEPAGGGGGGDKDLPAADADKPLFRLLRCRSAAESSVRGGCM